MTTWVTWGLRGLSIFFVPGFIGPRMASAVEKKTGTCERCVRRKSPVQKAAPLVNIQTSRPLELLCMDFLSVEPDSSNTKDILV